MKELLMGNEAIARGAVEAGVKVVAAYPGTPSSSIVVNFISFQFAGAFFDRLPGNIGSSIPIDMLSIITFSST
ncbi:MAG: hypothetical protein HXS40_13435 [Theionarchaea archaeon]|nr:hypothetical protein [Theionarchaea archaeon]